MKMKRNWIERGRVTLASPPGHAIAKLIKLQFYFLSMYAEKTSEMTLPFIVCIMNFLIAIHLKKTRTLWKVFVLDLLKNYSCDPGWRTVVIESIKIPNLIQYVCMAVYDLYLWKFNKKFRSSTVQSCIQFNVSGAFILSNKRLLSENPEQVLWVELPVDVYHDFIQIVYMSIVYVVDGIVTIITFFPLL